MKWIVPFVDFSKQFNTFKKKYIADFSKVMAGGNFTLRNDVKIFESKLAKFLKVKYVIGVNSGTDALFLSLGSLGLKRGSEIISVGHTFIATISSIAHTGSKPVICDISEDYNIDVEKIEKLITKNTKAILPVHLNGRSCNMDKIIKIAKKYNLIIIEDAAQSLGAKFKNKMVGTFGKAGCFSLHPLKSLGGAGDGGFVATNDKKLYKKIYRLRNHGQISREDIAHYGFCSRLDNIQAAILNIKFKSFKSNIIKRRKIASIYSNNLKNLPLILPSSYVDKKYFDTYNSYVVRTLEQKKLVQFLKRKKIETLINWPKPIYKNKGLKIKTGKLPKTEKIVKQIVSLPIYPEMSNKQIHYVIDMITDFFRKK